MAKIYNNVLELAGHTPLVRLRRLEQSEKLTAALYAKLEIYNPTRSSADRAAGAVLTEAENAGALHSGDAVAASARGNEAIALAQWATVKGFHLTVVLAGKLSREQRKLLGGYSVKIIPSPQGADYAAAAERARTIAQEENALFVDPAPQENDVHYRTTGPEIWDALDGAVDVFVAPAEEYGILDGIGHFLKEKNPAIEVIAAPEQDAKDWVKALAQREGILAGLSSGTALAAAVEQAKKLENAGKTVVVLLPDTGERYLSSGAYCDVLLPPEPF